MFKTGWGVCGMLTHSFSSATAVPTAGRAAAFRRLPGSAYLSVHGPGFAFTFPRQLPSETLPVLLHTFCSLRPARHYSRLLRVPGFALLRDGDVEVEPGPIGSHKVQQSRRTIVGGVSSRFCPLFSDALKQPRSIPLGIA